MPEFRGSCLCGAVRFSVDGELPQPHACHCSKCRKNTGHFEVGTDVPRENLRIEGATNITWFQSSDWARRGFCSICGSPLFFDPSEADWMGINMGAFDTPTNTKIQSHIFVADKGDYYEITDGLPQFDQAPETRSDAP